MGPPWFRLLDQYRREGHFGLTPSFLVGALRTPPGAVLDEQTSLAEFRALLESMRDETPSGFHVRIGECPRLRQPVAAAFIGTPAPGDSSLGEPIPPREGLPPKLYAWPQYFANASRSASSKLFWLKHKDSYVIYDRRAVTALRHLGCNFPNANYGEYWKCWQEQYSQHRTAIETAASRLPDVRAFLPWHRTEEELMALASQQWFLERVFDIYLWEMAPAL